MVSAPIHTSTDLGIVVVSWNVCELTERCLLSIEASLANSKLAYKVVVVDNASDDGTVEMIAARFPQVQVQVNSANRGFAGGVNDGLALLGVGTGMLATYMPRYMFVLNPDTEIVADAVEQLVAYLDAHPHVAVVGPQLRYADGSTQSSRRRFPTIAALFWESTLLEQCWPQNPWARHYRVEEREPTMEQAVDWLVGAALMIRCTAIVTAGGLDEHFFMYSEELEWQERITRAQSHAQPIVFLPDATVMHYEGRSSEQNILRRHLNFQRSKLRYTRMRFGRGVEGMLRIFLLSSYVLQAAAEMVKWVLGHKRSLRAARVQQYAQIIRSGL
jgi:GT2 family glycosyltransferase